jgi:hypothetical protein
MCSADDDRASEQGPTSPCDSASEECLGCGGLTPVGDLENGLCLGCRTEPDLEGEVEEPESDDPEPWGEVVA